MDDQPDPTSQAEVEEAKPAAAEPVSPEARAKAAPAKEAVKEAIGEITTPEEAQQVADTVLDAAAGPTERDIREEVPAEPEPGQAVKAAAATTTPGPEKASATLLTAAEQVAGSSGETREALEQALQSVLNPEQRGERDPELEQQRSLLREAILARMKPYQKIDVRLFLAVNHLPHSPLTNGIMSALTIAFNGGIAWFAGLFGAMLFNRRRHRRPLLQIAPPLWFATLIVEYPIKYYFRRRRPFIDIVQAITIGRKPGSYSFPSGHSAAAFAGAWLMSRHYPLLTPLWYVIATLVAFSRIYLGVHYPGDVISGSLIGTLLAEVMRRVIDAADDDCD
ncbi:MAG TPA: phosphatase PAP2 family protein [Anaerolineae bacterium]|nr:phosphatase PAP2 family protein [Anaerolineae bacterium]